jgi:hypothetical protein
MRIRTDKR